MQNRTYETRERLLLVGLLVTMVAPFIPIGGGTLYQWMSQYTMDTIGGARTGYVLTFLLCWLICMLPMLAWTLASDAWSQRKASKPEVGESSPPMPTLDDLRTTFHVGMLETDFFVGCDLLMERFGGLRVGTPAANETLISIHVAEGDAVLFFLTDGALAYAEYEGGVFMGD